MSTTASGTTFTLRTPAHIKSCHLTGTWDKYTKRYQMNADKSAGPGWWTLTLKFGSSLPPQRYWYYVRLHFSFIRLTSRSFFFSFFSDSLQQIYHFLFFFPGLASTNIPFSFLLSRTRFNKYTISFVVAHTADNLHLSQAKRAHPRLGLLRGLRLRFFLFSYFSSTSIHFLRRAAASNRLPVYP
jgi:hypothetical protein